MSQELPIISVCIANYNGIGKIDDCLQSVMAQQGNIHENYPDVVLIESDVNVGFYIENNRMMTTARGQLSSPTNYVWLIL